MQLRYILVIISIFTIQQVAAQPMASYILSPQPEISRGNMFKHIVETSEVLIKGVNTPPTKVEKRFNINGLMVSSVTLNSAGGKTNETIWNYANDKYLVRKFQRSFVNMRGWSEEEVQITWDENHTLPSKIEVLKNGKLWQWAILLADSLKRIESARVISSTGAHVFTERFVYIEASNMIKVMVYRANGVFTGTSSFPLDQSKPFVFESVSRKCYPNGDIMIETLVDASKGDQAYYYEYEYDSQGNWITKNTYQVKLGKNDRISNKKIENRVTRVITYL